MVKKIVAEIGKKLVIEDNVEEMYEKVVTKYGNGAKIDCQKRNIGKKAVVIILKD